MANKNQNDDTNDNRTRKERALDKLGDIVFGKHGKSVDNTAIGDEADKFLREKGRGSSDEGGNK